MGRRWLDFWLGLHKGLVQAKTGARLVVRLGSGYDSMADQEAQRKKLVEACAKAIAQYPAKDLDGDGSPDETYCNFAVRDIAEAMGLALFKGLTANQIHAKLLTLPHCRQDTGDRARLHAEAGQLAIASQTGQVHGHVAVVYPGPMSYSGKWGTSVPMVANVGRTNGVMGANFAFKDQPTYFLLEA